MKSIFSRNNISTVLACLTLMFPVIVSAQAESFGVPPGGASNPSGQSSSSVPPTQQSTNPNPPASGGPGFDIPYSGSNVNVVNQATSPTTLPPGAQGGGTNLAPGAQGGGTNLTTTKTSTLTNPLKVDSISGLVQTFVEIFSYLAILFAVLALIWVGFRFILARGDSTKMNELKSWLMWIVVGVAVVIGARLIIQVVINTLSATGTVNPGVIQSVQKAASGQ